MRTRTFISCIVGFAGGSVLVAALFGTAPNEAFTLFWHLSMGAVALAGGILVSE